MRNNSSKKQEYFLEERTSVFGENIIEFVSKLTKNSVNSSVINQLVRSATSIGANYTEANGASSKRDFQNKIYICKKESKETKFWLRMLAKSNPEQKDSCRKFWAECQELTKIFSKIIITLKKKNIRN